MLTYVFRSKTHRRLGNGELPQQREGARRRDIGGGNQQFEVGFPGQNEPVRSQASSSSIGW